MRRGKKRPPNKIPVGRHRVQMDIQQLPAIKGSKGFEYTVSLIHLSTRFKYSEIHSEATSKICAEVFKRALQILPPFFIVFTDNAMVFTMKYAHYSQRQTTFEKTVKQMGIIPALIPKGKPWRNGFIERSNRTDNEELFKVIQFLSSEERKYYLKLWEMEYNFNRPHQGINNLKPIDMYRKQHPTHLATRSIC